MVSFYKRFILENKNGLTLYRDKRNVMSNTTSYFIKGSVSLSSQEHDCTTLTTIQEREYKQHFHDEKRMTKRLNQQFSLNNY